MAKIEWNQSLAVGIDLIDEQHKMLLDRLNNISQAIDRSEGLTKISETLDFMIEYTDFHFSEEEKHMEATSYPELETHRMLHNEFRIILDDLVSDFRDEGATQILADSVNNFLYNWLVKHIKGTDTKFGTYLEEKGYQLNF
jgi:hemerythrin